MIRIKKIDHKSDLWKNQTSRNVEHTNSDELYVEKWLYTREDVSHIFQVSLVTLWNWKNRNILTPIPPVGGKIYYTRNSILQLVDPYNELKS